MLDWLCTHVTPAVQQRHFSLRQISVETYAIRRTTHVKGLTVHKTYNMTWHDINNMKHLSWNYKKPQDNSVRRKSVLTDFKVPVEDIQAYRRSRGLAPLIPNLGTGREWSNLRHSPFSPLGKFQQTWKLRELYNEGEIRTMWNEMFGAVKWSEA